MFYGFGASPILADVDGQPQLVLFAGEAVAGLALEQIGPHVRPDRARSGATRRDATRLHRLEPIQAATILFSRTGEGDR